MGQTLRQMRRLASGLGITLAELIRRRASRSQMAAYVDDSGTVRIKPRMYVDTDLPGWRPVFRTLTD